MHYKATLLLATAGAVSAKITHVKRAAPVLPANWAAAGCYTDSWDRTIATQVASNSNSLSIDSCVKTCDQGGYTFAGAEAGNECYCSKSLASTGAKVGDGECATACTGSKSQTCGGGWRLSVYKKSTTTTTTPPTTWTPPTGWTAQGCYSDSWTRTIVNQVTTSSSLTMTDCINTCSSKGYSFAGAEAGNECYCSNSIASTGSKVANTQCATPCGGAPGQTCGGGWLLSVFKKDTTTTTTPPPTSYTPPSGWSSTGCYADSWTRTLVGYTYTSTSLKIDQCISDCNVRNYKYAGMEAGNECYCSNTIASTGAKSADADCKTTCTGGSNVCGGDWRLSVYQNDGYTTTTPPPTTGGSTTFPGSDKGWKQEGCYTDDWTRTLQGYSSQSGSQTVESCQAICYAQKYRYAGLESGTECYCADQLSRNTKVADTDCATACSGSNSEMCGGGWRLSIYSHAPATSGPSTFEKVGCFVDSSAGRFLRGSKPNLAGNNTPDACISACVSAGYGYAGVEWGQECYCGDQLWNVQSKDESECNVMACSGDSSKKCGDGNRIMLYQDTLGWCS